jgi:hypothetical protein
MVVEFTTAYAIVAYHHLSCEFEPHSWGCVLIGGYVFNTTFKNISVTTFVAEIGVPREIHRPVVSH